MSWRPHASKDPQVIRASTLALSTSFDAAPTEARMQGWNQAILFCDLTLATATDVRIKVEFASPKDVGGIVGDTAPGATDWYQQTYGDTPNATGSAGTVEAVPVRALEWTLSASGRYALPIQCNYKWIRVSAKTTGGPGATTLGIILQQGNA